MTSAFPSGRRRNTLGAMATQTPQPMQRFGLTAICILVRGYTPVEIAPSEASWSMAALAERYPSSSNCSVCSKANMGM
jgi:hypothetical protein